MSQAADENTKEFNKRDAFASCINTAWELRSLIRGARVLLEDSEHGMSDASLCSASALLRIAEGEAVNLANAVDEIDTAG
ncbi:hypothetical protein SAMN04488038_108189 [Solimonas aquatica]|uniref:Uncharacterized protein n=1 Tax=Solimonas aquatica TaxID=489703 RepID=A0A1H9HIH9_9GAMM|nr:hypothetical protein SAMN04488038_108189 [Solimonas aquatica]